MKISNIDGSWGALYNILKSCIRRIPKDPLYYLELHGLTRAVSELVFFEDTLSADARLAHYTSWENVIKMFGLNHDIPVVRMYNYELANDPEEGKIKPPEWEAVEDKAVNELFGDLVVDKESLKNLMVIESAFGCSFSSGPCNGVGDDMTYWRLYGNDGQGCSMRISSLPAKGAYKVRYRHRDFASRSESDKLEDERVATRLNEFVELAKEAVGCTPEKFKRDAAILVANALFRVLYGYYHLVKHVAYKDEQEWRVIRVMPKLQEVRYDIDSPNLVKRYVNGPMLSELLETESVITIDPTVPNSAVARDFLNERVREEHGILPVSVRVSSQSYRLKPFPYR